MEWEPIKLSYRLFCGFLALGGGIPLLIVATDTELLKQQQPEMLLWFILGGVGGVLFLLAAIFGKSPKFPVHAPTKNQRHE
jgi:multisubunit Na+/H+ antiporter MnhB subunit